MCCVCHGCAFTLGSLFCIFLLHYRLKTWFIYFLIPLLREEFEIRTKILLELHACAREKRAGPVFVHTSSQVKLQSSPHCSWGAMHRADTGHWFAAYMLKTFRWNSAVLKKNNHFAAAEHMEQDTIFPESRMKLHFGDCDPDSLPRLVHFHDCTWNTRVH